jgi:hypothetical protein
MKAASHFSNTSFFTAPLAPAWRSADQPASRRTKARPVILLEENPVHLPEILIRTILMLCTVYGLGQCVWQFAYL